MNHLRFQFSTALLCVLSIANVQHVGGQEVVRSTYIYKTTGDLRIRADVYRKPDDIVRPALLWIHGGALIMGNRGWLNPVQAEKYLNAGYTIISIDYRLAPQAAGTVSTVPALEIIDYRNQAHPLPVLQRLLEGASAAQIQVWAEGEANFRLSQTLGGFVFDREWLSACETLVIWTTPPGWVELRQVITCCKPGRVVVFAVDPELDQAQAFLQRLAGLVKYVLSKQAGRASLTHLAAATAQKEAAVRLGLEWWAARGNISILNADEDIPPAVDLAQEGLRLRIAPAGALDLPQAADLLEQLQLVLAETHAYRAYFSRSVFALPP